MGRQKEETVTKVGPEAAERLRALFARWTEKEAEGLYDDEPSWEKIRNALDEERENEETAA